MNIKSLPGLAVFWLVSVLLPGALAQPLAPLTVTLDSPTNSATFVAGDNIPLLATVGAESADASVEFYVDDRLIGTKTNAPYVAAWSNVRPGSNLLTAVAQDLDGLRATSAPVVIQVALDPTVVTLVGNQGCWHYWDQGADPGSDWTKPGYDDSAWRDGVAELGYGDGDEATVLGFGLDAENKNITSYFRRRFSVADPGVFTNLVLRLKRDDGAVVYLNGTEIYRDNLPVGPITPLTLAMPAADDGSSYLTASVSPESLRSGENTLAVEVHQDTNTSPDLSFDLELLGQVGLAAPTLSIAVPTASTVVLTWPKSAGPSFVLQSRASADIGPWSPVLNPPVLGAETFTVTAATDGPSLFYRLCAAESPTLCQPPLVVSQPLYVQGAIGSDLTVGIVTTGAAPIRYQWYHNLLPVPGANSPSLTLLDLQRANGGSYELCMSNQCGIGFSCPIIVVAGGTNALLADNFSNRPTYDAVSGAINSSNYFATAELGEPLHVGRAARNSVWLRYVAPVTGIVTFSTAGSAFDTVLAAYDGTSLGALAMVDGDDDSGPAYSSEVSFALTSGQEIALAVDGVPEQAGVFQLTWSMVATLDVVPLILVQPVGRVAPLGSSFTLSVVATNPASVVPLTYQWRHSGTNLVDETNATLIVTSAQFTDAGDYLVVVSNGTYGKSSQPASVNISVGTGQLINVTSGTKRRKCGFDAVYSISYRNPLQLNGYFPNIFEPVQVRTWTADPGSVPTATALIFSCYALRSDLQYTCTQTWVPVDVPPVDNGPYFYTFEILVSTLPKVFFVNYF